MAKEANKELKRLREGEFSKVTVAAAKSKMKKKTELQPRWQKKLFMLRRHRLKDMPVDWKPPR